MRKNKKIIAIFVVILIFTTLTGCSFNVNVGGNNSSTNVTQNNGNNENKGNNESEAIGDNTSNNTTKFTIAELKAEYKALGASQNQYMFKPFYNVSQTTEFTFHFNSNVDPIKAITVHTDSKCEENSTIYQLNDGYKTPSGVDVIVKPKNPVLTCDDRLDAKETKYWGYAPIYYLCIRYDLDSNEVKKLDEPIIIPFTIKNDISTPNAFANIDEKGNFSVKWLPVEGAVSYRVYRATPPLKRIRDGARSEYAYVGDFMDLEDTFTATEFEFTDEKTEKENLFFNKNGYITKQNYNFGYTYYVTAVDSKGNESFFSKPVAAWQYNDVLPYEVKNKDLGLNDSFYLEKFLDKVAVTSRDGETIRFYPINYYRIGTPSEYSDKCEYKYEVVGTALTGKINYQNAEKNFPEQHLSEFKMQAGLEMDRPNEEIAPVDVDTIVDESYQNSIIQLDKKIDYPAEAKIKYDPAKLMIRADIEAARIIAGTGYTKSLDTIDSYIASERPEYVLIKDENGAIIVRKAEESDFIDSAEKPQQEPEKKPQEPEQKPQQPEEKPQQPEEKPQQPEEKPQQPEEKPQQPEVKNEPAKEITNDNYVEEQRKSTENQVNEADKEEIKGTEYPVFAETAGQKYLALQMINQEKEISLKAFPNYQVFDELADDLFYVWYQNPYIMGFDASKTKYDYINQILYVDYNVEDSVAKYQQEEINKKANAVVNEIIKPGMTDQEKVYVIYEYLEKNATYNQKACDSMLANENFYKKYANSWNTYGILCEKNGVCQSYAYAFNLLCYMSDVDSVMVTGKLGSIGHAWNAVKFNNEWYMLDVTNNGDTTGIPYWICGSSYDFIYENGFSLDDGFVDGTNVYEYKNDDEKQDWYYVNGLMPRDGTECAEIWLKNRNKSNRIAVKYSIKTQAELDNFMSDFVTKLASSGVTRDEVANLKFNVLGGVVLFEMQN